LPAPLDDLPADTPLPEATDGPAERAREAAPETDPEEDLLFE
jgi:hypothetical protein